MTCVSLVFYVAVAHADQVTLYPTQDNTLFADNTGALSNGAGPGLFVGNNAAQNSRRALLRFEIDLPDGATIDSVTLRLHVASAPNEVMRNVDVHRVLSAWGEGASFTEGGRGAEAQSGDATWLHRFYADSLWAVPGGDFEASASARVTLGDVGTYNVFGDDLLADVRAWVAQPESNHGWLLRGDETQPSTVRRIDSREVQSESDRPALIIEFSTATALREEAWGRVKNRFRRR